jgi:serine/threonine protein kinase
MKTASIFEELEGRTIDGKFALLEKLGASEGGSVFLTLRLGGQRALIKLVRAEGADAEACLARWEAAKALAHPHIIRVFEFGSADIDTAQIVYVVTETADDVLSDIIRERALDPLETRDTFGPILDALSYLHATGIIHGHVKPSNSFRIGDTAKLSSDNFLVAPGVPRVAPRRSPYDAPELQSGRVTPAADVWSIGMMLCEAMTQQLPHLVADGGLVVPDTLPKSFASIAQECLRFDPEERCTVSEIIPRIAPGLSLPAEFFSGPSRPAAPAPPPSEQVPPSPESIKIVEALSAANAAENALRTDAARNGAPAAPSRWQQEEPASPEINQFSPEPPPRRAAPPLAPAPTPSQATTPPPPRHAPGWRSKWDSDTSAPLPELFSQYEEKEPRSHIAPFFLGALVLLAFGVVLLVRSSKIDLPALEKLAQDKYTALTHSAPTVPESQPQTPSASQPDTAQSATSPQEQPATQPDDSAETSSTSPQQPAASTEPAPQPESSPTSSAAQPADSTASPSEPPPAAPAAPVAQTPAPPPVPAHTEPALPTNSEGAVAHQTMPSVSSAAIESMHGPVRVTVRVDVNPKGDVSSAAYVSPGEGNYFARVSRRAAEQWKFQPPRAHSRSLASVWTLHFYFTGRNVDVTAVQDEP